MDTVNDISRSVDSFLKNVYSNKTANAVIGLFLVLYAGLAAPKLPRSVANIFGNKIFKIVILFLIAYMSSRNISVAIIASVALAISMQTFSYHQATKKVQQVVEEEVNNMSTNSDIEILESDDDMQVEEQKPEPIDNNQQFEEQNNNSLIMQETDDEIAYVNQGEDYAKFESNSLDEEDIQGEYGPEGNYKSAMKLEEETLLKPEIKIEDNEPIFDEVQEEVPEPVALDLGSNEELINYEEDNILDSKINEDKELLMSEVEMPTTEEDILKPEIEMQTPEVNMNELELEKQIQEIEMPVPEPKPKHKKQRKPDELPLQQENEVTGYSGQEFANY